jgi:Leucine-rich repeat (LRR) protein
MQQLLHLNLSHNSLSGSLPLSWASLSSLRTLDMSNNTLQVRRRPCCEASLIGPP